MEQVIHDEKNGLNYESCGDYYLPCLEAPELPELGRFGKAYLRYLKNCRPGVYDGLLLSGKLGEHLKETDLQAEEMFLRLVKQLAEKEGITEMLKAADQMAWVGQMNNIYARAKEIVLNEINS